MKKVLKDHKYLDTLTRFPIPFLSSISEHIRLSQRKLEETRNTLMLNNMNAAQVIREIDALPTKEQSKVMAHLYYLQEKRFHEEQVKIAEQRLADLENGLEETVSHEEAMHMIREG